MNSFLDQLLGLRTLSTKGEGVEFRFAHDLPAWGWTLALLGCFAIAGWAYWKLLGPKAGRFSLAAVRALLLALVLALIAGPELVKPNERLEKDWVVVLADRSASMMVADVPPFPPLDTSVPLSSTPEKSAGRMTREQQLTQTIQQSWPTFAALAKDRNVLFLGFEGSVTPLRVNTGPDNLPSSVDLGQPVGRRTSIGQALEQTLRRVAARPVAGVVLLTDGRSSDTPSRATLKQLESRQIPIFAVPLGSEAALIDLAIARVEAPSAAFVGDIVPVTVDVQALGGSDDTTAANQALTGAKVQLVDTATGRVLDEQSIDSPESAPSKSDPTNARITLTSRPDAAGPGAWAVRVVPAPPGQDLSPDNNTQPLGLEVVDRPIRVAYFDGYPRWEYRYVKNLLLREKSVRSSAMLLASNRRYIQEGTDVIDILPRSPQEWAQFDVLVIGDLRPALFSDEQLRQIRSLVAERGAGLLWIAGPSATPAAWKGTPLADLIPFSLANDATGSGPQAWTTPVVMRPGPAARRYGVLQLGETANDPWPAMLSSPELGWPQLQWAQRLEPAVLKPTAEVIALAQPSSDTGTSIAPSPLVLTMRYGAGRVVYTGTDETWRFRYGRGEILTERFWIPLVRLLARESLGRSGKPALLQVSPDRAQINQQVQISVRLLDQSLLEHRAQSLRVRVTPKSVTSTPSKDARSIELVLKPSDGSADASSASIRSFSTSWIADEPGIYTIDTQDPLLAGLGLEATLTVALPDDELRVPQTDHPGLFALATTTGGQVLPPERLSELASLLPNRQITVQGTPDIETLWDKPVVWILLMTLLAIEWIGRRIIKLP